jgi:G3E family GTPase
MTIPLHIVSGFLGSGKTTFVKKIIDRYSERYRLGIIQNEFSPASIDGVELQKSGNDFHLLEINNGSVFCVCLLGDFSKSLEKFIDEHHPDVLLIEASGLSDTTAVAEVMSSGRLSEKIHLATHWTIVDALHFHKAAPMRERMVHQIRMADSVLLNKVDLARSLKELMEEIQQMNPFASIHPTNYCDIDVHLGDLSLPKFFPDPAHPLQRPDVNSMVLRSSRKISREALVQFLNRWAPQSYRIKGYVNLTDGSTLAVQCVFDRVELRQMAGLMHPTELIALTARFTFRQWNQSFKEHVLM